MCDEHIHVLLQAEVDTGLGLAHFKLNCSKSVMKDRAKNRRIMQKRIVFLENQEAGRGLGDKKPSL